MNKNIEKPEIIFLGKLPPPYIGPAMACKMILDSDLKNQFHLIHLDTSDHRDINTLGKIDWGNIREALSQYYRMIKLLAKHRNAMVYLPAGQSTIGYTRDAIFIIMAKLAGRKVISHLRGGNFMNWYGKAPGWTKWLVRKVHPKVDAQIVLGNNLRSLFNWLIPDEKIHVIPNGGNFTIPAVERNNDKIRILYLANFAGYKGILDVLYASRYLADLNDRLEFYFAGSWRDEATKTAFLKYKDEHPELNITVAGPVSGADKFRQLALADIFVFPSTNEGHPWVIVEAMSAALPIISTNVAAIPESVIDGYNGYLVPVNDPQSIAGKIRMLVQDDELRNTMGKASLDHYHNGFTHEIMIERLGNVFRKVASQ